jgi:hypothetical protein
MDNKELNIKSSTVEKGLELAKEFLVKLIGPTVEEFGMLVGDNVKYLRFKNQVKILLKAKAYVEKRNLNVKEIPVKILVPLLENSSLEENTELQDKWAIMLTNMVDSELNLQNHIFPYLLGQISIQEFNQLKKLSNEELEFIKEETELRERRKSDLSMRDSDTRKLHEKLDEIEQRGFTLDLEAFEKANLMRLALIRELPPRIYIEQFSTGSYNQSHALDASYYDHDNVGCRITELGNKFLDICELKKR